MIPPTSENKDYKLISAGLHQARCVSVIDQGTQMTTGVYSKESHQVRIVFEVPGELRDDDLPYRIGRTYTLSLYEKSNLRKDLGAWRGKQLTPEECKTFDLKSLLDKTVNISVTHMTNNSGDEYAAISAFIPMKSGEAMPERYYDLTYFSLANFDKEIYGQFPEWLQQLIAKSPEYQNLTDNYQSEKKDTYSEKIETKDSVSVAKEVEIPF